MIINDSGRSKIDNDSRFSRNEVMGSAKVPLSRVEVAGGAEVWAELSRERRPPEELQELLLSLSYLPSAERLTVVVLKARNLLPPQEGKDALGKYITCIYSL